MSEVFLKAAKRKLRFRIGSVAGLVSTEDLWDVSLTALDAAAIELRRSLNASEESFIADAKPSNSDDQLRLDVMKLVIADRLAEREARRQAAELSARRKKLMELRADKQDETLKGLTLEQIDAELAKTTAELASVG